MKYLLLTVFILLNHSIYSDDWRYISNNKLRDGQFISNSNYLRLDFTGLNDVSFNDPKRIVYSSGRVIEGEYQFGFFDENLLDLFSGSVTTGIVVDNNKAYFGTSDKEVIALDLGFKRVLWSVKLDSFIKAEPIVLKDRVYFCDLGGQVTAISKLSGGVDWKVEMNSPIIANPVLKDDHLILISQKGLIQVLSVEHSNRYWSYQLPTGVEGTPLVVDNKVWIGTLGGDLVVFDLISGNKELQIRLSGAVKSGMCLVKSPGKPSLVVLGTIEGGLHFFKTGGDELLHSPYDIGFAPLTPISSQGLVYVCHELSLFQINPWLGESLFEFTPSGHNFVGDLVYDGKVLHAISVIEKKNSISKILDYQFSFENREPNLNLALPILMERETSIDGKVLEDEWEGALKIPHNWLVSGSPHFEEINLYLMLSKGKLKLAGEFRNQGGSKQVWNALAPPHFEVTLSESKLNFEHSFKVNPIRGLSSDDSKEKKILFKQYYTEDYLDWSFETEIPVSNFERNEKYNLKLKSRYVQNITRSKDENLIFEFVNHIKDSPLNLSINESLVK